MNKRSHLPRRAWATALAVCAHLLALLALGWRIPTVAEKAEADLVPPVEVTLVRPPRPVQPTVPVRAAAPVRQPHSASLAPAPAPLPPVLTQPAPAAPPAEAAPDHGEHFRSALRGLVGCSDPEAYHLTRDERAACDQRLAAAKPAPLSRQYSAAELAQFDAENKYDPILARKPHNGCLPGAGAGSNAPPGTSSAAATTFGIRCSWSFW